MGGIRDAWEIAKEIAGERPRGSHVIPVFLGMAIGLWAGLRIGPYGGERVAVEHWPWFAIAATVVAGSWRWQLRRERNSGPDAIARSMRRYSPHDVSVGVHVAVAGRASLDLRPGREGLTAYISAWNACPFSITIRLQNAEIQRARDNSRIGENPAIVEMLVQSGGAAFGARMRFPIQEAAMVAMLRDRSDWEELTLSMEVHVVRDGVTLSETSRQLAFAVRPDYPAGVGA